MCSSDLGPDRVTVEAIAEAAGVSTRTFFNYFPTKDDAILGIDPAEQAEMMDDLRNRPAGEAPLDTLRTIALDMTGRLEVQADELIARRHLAQRHPALAVRRAARLAESERAMVEEIAARTGLDPDVDPYPTLVVAAALAALRAGLTVWYERARPESLAEALAATFDQLAAGLPMPALVR